MMILVLRCFRFRLPSHSLKVPLHCAVLVDKPLVVLLELQDQLVLILEEVVLLEIVAIFV